MKCLVIGQGIAGTLLAWTLARKGADVQVADAGFPFPSSEAAAGIINPVTGKRYVKSWRFDTFFPFARRTYLEMETDLRCAIWQEQPMLRLLPDAEACNNWSTRIAAADYSDLLAERTDAGSWSGLLAPAAGIGEIRQAARVDFPVLLRAFREKIQAEGRFLSQPLDSAAAADWAKHVDFVIFCEGARGATNPYFPGLPWQLSKGEGFLLNISHPGAGALREMVKQQLTLVPLRNGLIWAGASYQWTFEDDGPNPAQQAGLEKQLAEMLIARYEIVQRFGAVRPTVKDRRPLIGTSSIHPKMILFNGLGTKGALLAPYWAGHLADHLLNGTPLDPEVDIWRFRHAG